VILVEKAVFCESALELFKTGIVIDIHADRVSCGTLLVMNALVGNPRLRDELPRLDGVRSEAHGSARQGTGWESYLQARGGPLRSP
jgi:hypothetical protein